MKKLVGNILYTDIIWHCSTSRKFPLSIGDGTNSYFIFTIHFSWTYWGIQRLWRCDTNRNRCITIPSSRPPHQERNSSRNSKLPRPKTNCSVDSGFGKSTNLLATQISCSSLLTHYERLANIMNYDCNLIGILCL